MNFNYLNPPQKTQYFVLTKDSSLILGKMNGNFAALEGHTQRQDGNVPDYIRKGKIFVYFLPKLLVQQLPLLSYVTCQLLQNGTRPFVEFQVFCQSLSADSSGWQTN